MSEVPLYRSAYGIPTYGLLLNLNPFDLHYAVGTLER